MKKNSALLDLTTYTAYNIHVLFLKRENYNTNYSKKCMYAKRDYVQKKLINTFKLAKPSSIG